MRIWLVLCGYLHSSSLDMDLAVRRRSGRGGDDACWDNNDDVPASLFRGGGDTEDACFENNIPRLRFL